MTVVSESGRDWEIEIRRRRVFVMFLINLILVLFMALELIGGIKLAGKNRTISPRAEILLALGRFSTAVFLLGLLIIR